MKTLREVNAERIRQDSLWGEQNHEPGVWYAILGEEVGEVGRELAEAGTGAREFDGAAYRMELVQVAAVAVAAIQAYDRSRA